MKNVISALKMVNPDFRSSIRTKSGLVCSKKSGSGPKSGNPDLVGGTGYDTAVFETILGLSGKIKTSIPIL